MNEIGAKFKRQIEILGIAIKNTESLRTEDLARMYGVERLTIKRDLEELRSQGLDIHSEGKRGVRLSTGIGGTRLRALLSTYLALSNAHSITDRASTLLATKDGDCALATAVALQTCIEQSRCVTFAYCGDRQSHRNQYTVDPLRIFQAGGVWRLLAQHGSILKQFLLTKIIDAAPTDKSFKAVPDERIEEVFRHSFLIWTGRAGHHIRLKLSQELVSHLRARSAIMFDRIKQTNEGTAVVDMTVNSLTEIAGWVVGMGGTVVVLSPRKLVTSVIRTAQATLRHHESEL